MNKVDKTLVILTPGFAKDETDTTCLPLQQAFTRSLKEIYPDMNIVVLSFQYPYFKKTYKWFDNISVISFNGRNKGGIAKLLLRQKLNAVLKDLHQTNKITGLLSFWYGECALIGKRFARRHGIEHFCWILGQDAKKENKYPSIIRPKAGELIALSDFLQDEFEKNHGVRPKHVIPAAIDTKQFNHTLKEKDIDILAVGSLIRLKQYDVFLDIISELKKQLPGIKAVLIGNGPEKARLQTLIAELGLESTVTLTGELPYPEVLQWMQRSKLLLHPSSYEGFSGVCLEALYTGAHVISFCKPMKQEIEHWHIVESKKEMTERAVSILSDPLTRYKTVTFCEMKELTKIMMELFEQGSRS